MSPPACSGSRELALVLCLLPILGAVVFLSSQGPLDFTRPRTLLGAGVAVSGWVLALALGGRARDSSALLAIVIGGALVLRIAFLFSAPELSDDIHRYVWEGGLVAEGVDPYGNAPGDARMVAFQQRWRGTYAQVNHPDVSAAYPPLTLLVQAALVRAAGGPESAARAEFLLRLFFALCDIGVCLPLARLLQRRGLSRGRLVAWAWNPWVALEFAGSGHFDSLAILCLVGGLACLASEGPRAAEERSALGLALLAAGAAVKLLPGALLPFALRGARRPLRGILLVGAVLLAALFSCAALTRAWPSLAGLGEYAFRWESSSLVYRWIEPRFAAHWAMDESWTDPRRLARGVVLLLWLVLAFGCWRRRCEPVQSAAVLVAGFLLLTPTLHPWYLCWLVPFLALWPLSSGCFLVAAAPLLYWPLAGWRAAHVWNEPSWLWPALAGPLLVLFTLDRARLRRARLP